jgi:hypothetical protein
MAAVAASSGDGSAIGSGRCTAEPAAPAVAE